MRNCIAIMMMFAVFAVHAKDEKPGKEFKSEEGKFSIVIPGEPKAQKLDLKAADDSDVKVALYQVESGGLLYIVSTSDYSEKYLKNSAATILDNAHDASVSRSKGKLVSEKNIKLKEHPGRDIVIDFGADKGVMRIRFYLVGGRQYSIFLHGKKEQAVTGKEADQFFDSFQLTK